MLSKENCTENFRTSVLLILLKVTKATSALIYGRNGTGKSSMVDALR
jgi:AAA15 family ATPase/GTPase